MNARQIMKKLEENGWQLRRVKGSHHIFARNGVTVAVPLHGAKDLGIGLIKSIEKQTGVRLL